MHKTCSIRIFRGQCDSCGGVTCDHCKIGCNKPARHKNPFFGTNFWTEDYWWRGGYSYAEYLCATCYDMLVSHAREMEEMYREIYRDEEFEENPNYTAILDTL